MTSIESLVRPALKSLASYVPAKVPAGQAGRVIKLDMNESPHGPSPKARAALAAFDQTHRYPTFDAAALREALSRYTGAPAEQIIPGAGLDDVLNNLLLLLIDPGDEVIISEPTFGVYRALVTHYGGVTVDVPLGPGFTLDADRVLAAATDRTKVVIVCTPNNPTGNPLDPGSVERIVAEAPCVVAIDEAYAEFGDISYLPFMERYPNVVVLRTLSKFAGLAGMRVGYGVFPTSLIPHLWPIVPPFCNLTLASTVAAIASLDDLPHLRATVARIIADREGLAANLRELPGVEPLPSATNFLLVRLPVADAAPIVAGLAARGVFVRHFGRPELGIADCLRVTVGLTEENEIFLTETEAVLREQGATA